MTQDEVKQLANDAADAAVEKWLTRLGLDAENPLEVQRDFAWLRGRRKLETALGTKAVLAAVTLVVGGLVSAVWLGLKAALGLKIGTL